MGSLLLEFRSLRHQGLTKQWTAYAERKDQGTYARFLYAALCLVLSLVYLPGAAVC